MISIQSCVNEELQKRPFYLKMLLDGTLNTTAFASQIQPRIQTLLYKNISANTIVACLARAKKTIKLPKVRQKIHSVQVKYPLVWMSFVHLEEDEKSSIIEQLPTLNSYYENQSSLVVSFKETMNQKPIHAPGVDMVCIKSVCQLTVEYHNQYHSETGLFYEIAKEFYWADINILDQSNNDRTVWLYIESKDINKALETIRNKFVVIQDDF
jgi:hypothetical protein